MYFDDYYDIYINCKIEKIENVYILLSSYISTITKNPSVNFSNEY
jgi:hypothetical protein